MAMPAAAPGPKYKAALSAAYAASLRVSEVVALKVSDIDSERLLLRIEQGKGRKDRFAMLSPAVGPAARLVSESACATACKNGSRKWVGSGRAAAITASSSESERRMGGMGNCLVGLRAKGRRARVRRSPIRLVRSRPNASGAGGIFSDRRLRRPRSVKLADGPAPAGAAAPSTA